MQLFKTRSLMLQFQGFIYGAGELPLDKLSPPPKFNKGLNEVFGTLGCAHPLPHPTPHSPKTLFCSLLSHLRPDSQCHSQGIDLHIVVNLESEID